MKKRFNLRRTALIAIAVCSALVSSAQEKPKSAYEYRDRNGNSITADAFRNEVNKKTGYIAVDTRDGMTIMQVKDMPSTPVVHNRHEKRNQPAARLNTAGNHGTHTQVCNKICSNAHVQTCKDLPRSCTQAAL